MNREQLKRALRELSIKEIAELICDAKDEQNSQTKEEEVQQAMRDFKPK